MGKDGEDRQQYRAGAEKKRNQIALASPVEHLSPVCRAIYGIGIAEKLRDDNVEQLYRTHGPVRYNPEVISARTDGPRNQLERRKDLYRRQGKAEHCSYYHYPHYPGQRLPPLIGFHPTPKRQASDQPHAALKCQRLERRSLEPHDRSKAQAPPPQFLLQSPQ